MRTQITKYAVAISAVFVCSFAAMPVMAEPGADDADSAQTDGAGEASEQQAEQPPANAEEILQQVDDELTAVEDLRANCVLTITDSSGSTDERKLTVMQKDDDKRLIQLTEPARLRGVGLLAKAEGQDYLYLPAMRRVRRIAGAERDEPFLDSDFTNDDLTRTTFSSRYRPELLDDDAEHWRLRLTPRDSDDDRYSKLRMKVRKKDHQPVEIEYFEEGSDEATRRLTTSGFDTVESQVIAHKFLVENLETGGQSTLELSDVEVNIGLDDSLFSRRQLQR